MMHLRNAPNILVPQYFGSTIFHRESSRYYPFDAETTRIWQRMNHTPFEAIINETADEGRRNQLWRFYEHFYEMGFFTIDNTFAGVTLDTPPADGHLTGPMSVHLEVSATCNLTCQHCFAGELPRKEESLTLAELDTLFASMARMGSYRLGLTGGEPLNRRDLFEIIDLATEHGLHPCLTTNGLLITEDIAREFGKRDLIWINVSLDGATAASNDLIRGEGVYERVLEKLKILGKHSRFTLAFTIMRNNLEEMEACVALAQEVGAETAVFRPLYPTGIALSHMELMPTFEEYNTALRTLSDMNGSFDACQIDPFSPRLRDERRGKVIQNSGCGAGNTVCSISLSGNVNPCSFLGAGYNAANIREQPFEEIWHTSQTFHQMRQDDDFNGGCRARSLAYRGSAHAPDPWVEQREAHHQRQPNVTFFDPMTTFRTGPDA